MATKYTKQKDGRWQTKVWDGTYNVNGTKHRVALYSTKSSKDLENIVRKFTDDLATGETTIKSDTTIMAYARLWLKTYKIVRERGTQIMYENIIEKHLISLDGLKISDIKKTHFQAVINNALDKPRTCQQIKVTFKQIIKTAISDRLLPANSLDMICAGIELPKYIAEEKRALTQQEKNVLKTADFTPKERAFIYILYSCGLRRGEALALTVFDISVERSELNINKALAFDGNDPYTKSTKSENGQRTLPVPAFAMEYLKKYIASLKGTTLFTMRNGKYMTKSSYDKMWASIVRKMNIAAGGTKNIKIITGLTAHVFRHNYCANLCYQMPNISIKKIAMLLGDTEKMVLDVYNHILDEKENANETVNIALSL